MSTSEEFGLCAYYVKAVHVRPNGSYLDHVDTGAPKL